ncbi:unnamed protein product [Musa acuminata subsp. burmannicoides]
MTTPSRRTSGPVLAFRPSISPRAGGGASFASSSSSITGRSRNSFSQQRSAQPPAPPVRFSLDRSISYGCSLKRSPATPARRTCLCSPSTHPGSFRCSLHKGLDHHNPSHVVAAAAASPSNRLNARRSAMANSLVRIGAVEGEWVKRALAALIRPSSHQQRRRTNFQPRPTRLSRMSKAVQPIDLESGS